MKTQESTVVHLKQRKVLYSRKLRKEADLRNDVCRDMALYMSGCSKIGLYTA